MFLCSSKRSKKKTGSVAFTPKISVDSAAAMRVLALAGAGITTVAEVIVRADVSRGRLVEILPRWQVALVGVYAVWPANAQRPRLTLQFIDFMAPRIAALFAPPSR